MGLSNYLPSSRLIQPGVCTSSTRPGSPYNGQVIYETDTGKTQVWNGSAWVMLTNSTAPPGLELIKTQSLSSVSNAISDVFSSTYDSYRVLVSNLNNGSSTTRTISLKFRTSSGDDSASSYVQTDVLAYPTNIGATGASASNSAAIINYMASNTEQGGAISIDIHNPNLSKATVYIGEALGYQSDVGQYVMRHIGGLMRTTTQYTGFSIIGVTDALSGTVRVYGYRNSI